MKQRKANRLTGYNYSQENLYFVTSCVQDMICCFGDIVRTGRDLSLPLKIKSLSALMGAYKMTVFETNSFIGYGEFSWQRSFYDHIIRDEKSHEMISNYIINNPNSWDQDKIYS